ncbi:hypothetical protein ACGFX4_00160 [Kitasatospora sp. NPDC048365]|uniref:hypothetical protein n=1 Tax=Kitasatospora sp. NPDC048365 TaxID=3364050 RepID=UPI0037164AD2
MSSSPKPAGDRGRQILLKVGLLLALGVVVRNAVAGDSGALVAGLAGGLGALLSLQLSMVWVLVGGRFSGFAVTAVEFGYGRRLLSTRIGGVPVGVRRLPFPFMSVVWAPIRRPGLRWRLVVSALLQLAVQIGTGLWLLDSAPAWAFPGAVAFLVFAVVMLATFSLPLTIGWVLFRMPFLPAEALATYALRPGEEHAARALRDGRIEDARAALERVADDGAPGFQSHLVHAGVDLAEGRYTEAAVEVNRALEAKPHPRYAAIAVGLRTASLVGAAETGTLPVTQAVPWLGQTVELLRTWNPMLLRSLAATADLALLENRREEALKLAGKAAVRTVDRFWEAHAACSHAAALASVGRPEQARAELDRARRAMPGLARIALVERRIELNVIEVDGPVVGAGSATS